MHSESDDDDDDDDHRRNQDFVWGCTFLPRKSWQPF